MIPILFDSQATAFDSFGIGALPDVISCEVYEERNGAYEMTMEYPITGKRFDQIALRSIITAKPNFTDVPQPFRVYKISKPLNGKVTINAEHICYDLSGQVIGEINEPNVQAVMTKLTSETSFEFSTDMTTTAPMRIKVPTSARAVMGGIDGSVIDTYGGEWSYDRMACRLSANRGSDRGVQIRYGKNLTSLKQEENCQAVYTAVYPFWRNDDTDITVTLPERTIAVHGTFSFSRIMPLDLSGELSEQPTVDQLRASAQTYIASNQIGVPEVSLDVDFVQMPSLTERVDLCDTVTVIFEELGVNATAKCVETTWDVLEEKYTKVRLGSARHNIASTIATIQQTAEQAKTSTSQSAATMFSIAEKVTGNLGGYVVMNDSDGNGEPDEILIMDDPNKEMAVNVVRMNKSGIAFSQNGYHGTYGTAWTVDGKFCADYIASGTIQANLIKIFGDAQFYWDSSNIWIKDPANTNRQIRIGKYDGVHYGIGITVDGGSTWETSLDFDGVQMSKLIRNVGNTGIEIGKLGDKYRVYVDSESVKIVELVDPAKPLSETSYKDISTFGESLRIGNENSQGIFIDPSTGIWVGTNTTGTRFFNDNLEIGTQRGYYGAAIGVWSLEPLTTHVRADFGLFGDQSQYTYKASKYGEGSMWSINGNYHLNVGDDGILRLYNASGGVVWHT